MMQTLWHPFLFLAVKHSLRELSVQHSLLFPAKLKVMHNNHTYLFTGPTLAWDWIETQFEGTLRPHLEPPVALLAGPCSRPHETHKGWPRRCLKDTPRGPSWDAFHQNQQSAIEAVFALRHASLSHYTGSSDNGSEDDTSPSEELQMGLLAGPIVTPQSVNDVL
ncbi:hypothetical protein NDU88_002102 [Pleurodeles waltl]|uniref:Uncharacterized protein n=1 Tax=Pleurodeles waltl TaxID=8319 RepID=A0AAV7LZX8_PLEWA|nr:hypothetical protein NDU88_002102 [Pleurodeles waltl]